MMIRCSYRSMEGRKKSCVVWTCPRAALQSICTRLLAVVSFSNTMQWIPVTASVEGPSNHRRSGANYLARSWICGVTSVVVGDHGTGVALHYGALWRTLSYIRL
ncbi:hypothetical protein M404DRAFT_774099 [Pisolithus tinctorius Marx 270]|uniref:Uncharacterized protein n=1 Tax=Pisolithus tinctorius Marx 270 TaxID=870435 RepID=A0A0C3JRK1_PISTI|nr:hypothetical protein M404DRAFT_312058 [Pisolithus tinctorius Marx 270]KIO00107.1 hypothetical protein M404DRAFT_774099 [Pisolithus tinctorius Marx 270]